VQMYHLFLH